MQSRVVEHTFVVNSEKKKTTGNGFLVNFDVPIARSGILEYAGHEVGMPDVAKVRAYRPVETFTNEVVESASLLPVTNDHPSSLSVNTQNARREVVGAVSEKVALVDNELIANSVVIFDEATINAVENEGKKELSIGFLANHVAEPGMTPDGEPYDVVETIERMNHLSVVNQGKAGSRYRLNSKEDDAMTDEVVSEATKDTTAELLNSMQEAQAKSLEAMGGEIKTYLNSVTEQIEALQIQVKEFVNGYKEKKMESDAEKEKANEGDHVNDVVEEEALAEETPEVVAPAPSVNAKEAETQMQQLFTANSAPVQTLSSILFSGDNK